MTATSCMVISSHGSPYVAFANVYVSVRRRHTTMGAFQNLVGWIGVAVVLVVFAGVVAVASGFILIGDPGTAISQVATGDVTAPNTSVEDVRFDSGGGDIGPAGLQGQVTLRFDLVINNSMNEIGGTVDEIDYDVAVSSTRTGPFTKVGDGRIRGLTVPPGRQVSEEASFTMDTITMAEALGGSLDASSDRYTRVSGNATIAFGPFRFDVPFEQVSRMEAGSMVEG